MVKQDGAQNSPFPVLNLPSAISVEESHLDYFRLFLFPKEAVVAKDLPPLCFSKEDLQFHMKQSTGCSVFFQQKFSYNYDIINIWEE